MKALPLWQPWATLIALGAKQVETRPWPPPESLLGERIAIYATKGGLPKGKTQDLCDSEPFFEALRPVGLATDSIVIDNLPRQALVATAVIERYGSTDPRHVERLLELNPAEHAFGDYSPHRWAWVMKEVQPLDPPIPCFHEFNGPVRFFDVPPELIPQLEGQGALFS